MNPFALQGAVFFTQIALGVIALAFLLKCIAWMRGKFEAPFVPTPVHFAPIVGTALDLLPGDVVYELGSGDGRFVLACAALEPKATFVGIERNPLLYIVSLLRRRAAGSPSNVEFRRGDFYRSDLTGATKVYAYLLDNVMHRLQPKFDREFKGRVASRAFPFPRKQLSNVVLLTGHVGRHGQHMLFVYDF